MNFKSVQHGKSVIMSNPSALDTMIISPENKNITFNTTCKVHVRKGENDGEYAGQYLLFIKWYFKITQVNPDLNVETETYWQITDVGSKPNEGELKDMIKLSFSKLEHELKEKIKDLKFYYRSVAEVCNYEPEEILVDLKTTLLPLSHE